MTTPVERMEAIIASLVQNRSQMDRSNATTNKLNANLGSVQNRGDTESPKRNLEAGIGTSATVDNKEVANGMKTPVERMEAIIASLVQERSQINRSNVTTNKLNANLGSVQKREDTENPMRKLEAGIGTSATIDNKEVASGEVGSIMTTNLTDNTTLKKRKRKKVKNNNPDLGGILSTHDSTHEGLSTTKVLEVKSDEMISVSAITATPDANIESKGDLLEVACGKTEESKIKNYDAPKLTKSQKRNRSKAHKKKLAEILNVKEKSKKKPDLENKRPTLAENLNPQYPQNLDASRGEKASGSTSTDNPVSKKLKRKLNKNSYLSDVLSTQEVLSTAKVLEVVVLKEQVHTEVANGKTGESETTNNGNDASMLTKSQKKIIKRALKKELKANLVSVEKREDTENPNSKPEAQFYSNTDIGTPATVDNMTSMSCPALGDILSTYENTSSVPQAVSAGVSQGEEHMKDANGSMGFRANTGLEVNDVGKEETEPKVSEKKLIILDVNGLLADAVSDLPNDVTADKYITRRAIFKRPYVNEFLSFCFERFHVGIWSSRTMSYLVPVVNFLLGDLKKKLLLLWDGCKCTDSGIRSLDVQYKNMLLKIFEKFGRQMVLTING